MVDALKDSDAGVRQQAVNTLQNIPGNAETVLPALEKLLKEDAGNVRIGIVQMLWRYRPKGMPLPLLLTAAKDADAGVRQQALWSMQNIVTTSARMRATSVRWSRTRTST